MPQNELVTYLREELARGVSHDALVGTLRASGWPEADITAAFAAMVTPPPVAAAPAAVPASSPLASASASLLSSSRPITQATQGAAAPLRPALGRPMQAVQGARPSVSPASVRSSQRDAEERSLFFLRKIAYGVWIFAGVLAVVVVFILLLRGTPASAQEKGHEIGGVSMIAR